MFNLGLFELTLFGVIALIVLGPEKLPEFARTLGKWYGLFRRTSARLQNDLMSELELAEAQAILKQEIEKIRASEAAMKAQMDELQHTLAKTQQDVNKNKRVIADAWQEAAQEAAQDTTQDNAEPANNPSTSAKNATSKDTSASIQSTKPMTYHWFLLGDYDRKRRLPAAPFLPDYTASALLYTPVMSEELS